MTEVGLAAPEPPVGTLAARASKWGKERGGVVVLVAEDEADAARGGRTTCCAFCPTIDGVCPTTGDDVVSIERVSESLGSGRL